MSLFITSDPNNYIYQAQFICRETIAGFGGFAELYTMEATFLFS